MELNRKYSLDRKINFVKRVEWCHSSCEERSPKKELWIDVINSWRCFIKLYFKQWLRSVYMEGFLQKIKDFNIGIWQQLSCLPPHWDGVGENKQLNVLLNAAGRDSFFVRIGTRGCAQSCTNNHISCYYIKHRDRKQNKL